MNTSAWIQPSYISTDKTCIDQYAWFFIPGYIIQRSRCVWFLVRHGLIQVYIDAEFCSLKIDPMKLLIILNDISNNIVINNYKIVIEH